LIVLGQARTDLRLAVAAMAPADGTRYQMKGTSFFV
jgi:hypothetical protein